MKKASTKTKAKKAVDLRFVPKKHRKVYTDKQDRMELGVLNNFSTVLSQEIVSVEDLANAITVDANGFISSDIVGSIVMRANGKGLDLRYLKEPFKSKYKQMEADAIAAVDAIITERISNAETITAEEFKAILSMANKNPLGEKIVATNHERQAIAAVEFEEFIKPV